MASPRRLAPVLATLALLCFAAPGAVAMGEGGGGKFAAERLIDAYVPRLMLRDRDEICDTSGEQYEPTTVNTVLGNPRVTLTEADSNGDETLVKRAPTAADIAGLGEQFHLNLPADPLGDTCGSTTRSGAPACTAPSATSSAASAARSPRRSSPPW